MSVLKKDHVMRDFFGHPGHFADFLNVLFFDGKRSLMLHTCFHTKMIKLMQIIIFQSKKEMISQ